MLIRRPVFVLVSVILAFSLIAAGCQTQAPAAPTKVAEPTKPAAAPTAPTAAPAAKAPEPTMPPAAEPTAELVIGELEMLSGGGAVYGIPAKNGRTLAVEEINAKGGVTVGGKKYKIKVIAYDEAPAPSDAVAAFNKLLEQDKVKIIMGITSSGDMSAIEPIVRQKDVLVITDQSADPRTTANPKIYGPRVTMATYSRPSVELAKEIGVKTAVTLIESNHSGIVAAHSERISLLQGAGMKVLAQEEFKREDTDFSAQLTKIKTLNPDLILLPAYIAPFVGIVKQYRELGISAKIIGNAGMPAPDVLKLIQPKLMEGVYNVGVATANELETMGDAKAKAFMQKYKAKFNNETPGYNTLMTYDATYILAHALEKAGSVTDLEKIKKALDDLKASEVPEMIQPLVPYPNGNVFKDRVAEYKMLIMEWQGDNWKILGLK